MFMFLTYDVYIYIAVTFEGDHGCVYKEAWILYSDLNVDSSLLSADQQDQPCIKLDHLIYFFRFFSKSMISCGRHYHPI